MCLIHLLTPFGVTNFLTMKVSPLSTTCALTFSSSESPAISCLHDTLLLSAVSHSNRHATENLCMTPPLFPPMPHASKQAPP